ncbi:hypothetical protein C5708_07150 [Caulobacter sp. CCUG 60055]|uniref:COG3650 family protein n=1 Tax=Caulobacter sp. CCUG 60055 TaxID=2100090 RepID=UPI001FA7C4F2|nr:hypothetical protein [Caulobacter sp. CCUG 60055]MCI3180029.1 hypothetical protein [Caulobacter sp. CCUG 60055]
MRPAAALVVLVLAGAVLAGCGRRPADSQEGPLTPPADAPAPKAGNSVPTAADFSGDLNALGAEPFWAVKVRAGGLTLSRPGKPDLDLPNGGAALKDGGAVWTLDKPAATLTLRLADCSDGMSDRRYPFKAELTLEGRTLSGCATHASAMTNEAARGARP